MMDDVDRHNQEVHDEAFEVELNMYPILKFFNYRHLPPDLRKVSAPFSILAYHLARQLPHCAETSAGLRKLLEAKDCAVRASMEIEMELVKDPGI